MSDPKDAGKLIGPVQCRICLTKWTAVWSASYKDRLQCPACLLRGGEQEWDKAKPMEPH